MTSETVPWMLSRVDGAYYGKILICAPMYKGGGYNRPDFVSHTRFRKFCWVQIACFCLPYPRQHKYIKILTGRCLRCPSVFLSVNIYFINGLLQPVRFHILELLQHFLGRSLSRQADCDDSDKSQSEAYYQGI